MIKCRFKLRNVFKIVDARVSGCEFSRDKIALSPDVRDRRDRLRGNNNCRRKGMRRRYLFLFLYLVGVNEIRERKFVFRGRACAKRSTVRSVVRDDKPKVDRGRSS